MRRAGGVGRRLDPPRGTMGGWARVCPPPAGLAPGSWGGREQHVSSASPPSACEEAAALSGALSPSVGRAAVGRSRDMHSSITS
ncbi:unnamed protein product [Caretta caretta]